MSSQGDLAENLVVVERRIGEAAERRARSGEMGPRLNASIRESCMSMSAAAERELEPALDPDVAGDVAVALEHHPAAVGQIDRRRAHDHGQRLAVAAAQARARWVAASIALMEKPETPAPQDVANLTTLRCAYEELTEAYEALRRMVERGYLTYRAKP